MLKAWSYGFRTLCSGRDLPGVRSSMRHASVAAEYSGLSRHITRSSRGEKEVLYGSSPSPYSLGGRARAQRTAHGAQLVCNLSFCKASEDIWDPVNLCQTQDVK